MTHHQPSPIYETAKSLGEYLLMHYGKEEVLNPFGIAPAGSWQYPFRCSQICLDAVKKYNVPAKRGLDIGCAVGRSTFELARELDTVVGIDFSFAFINTAKELQEKGLMKYHAVEEGEIVSPQEAVIDSTLDRSKVVFQQGDACDLHSESLGGRFDVILMANLICRLHTPTKCLELLSDLVNQGGLVVMFTPCSWLPEFTEKSQWLGGFTRINSEGKEEEVRTIDTLKVHLADKFELLETSDQPFLIREHRRKYQLGVALASIWKRK